MATVGVIDLTLTMPFFPRYAVCNSFPVR